MSRYSQAAFLAAFLCLTPELWAQDEIEGAISLNGGARITNSSTVQVRVRLGSPAPVGLEMAISTDSGVGTWRPYAESQPLELPPGDGERTVTVRLRDAAGQKSAVLRASIVVDTTPPEAKVRVSEGVAGGTVTLISEVPDAVAMQWSEDATRWGPWVPYLQPRVIALSPGGGMKTLLVRYRDEAGNISKPAMVRVETKADSAAPATSVDQVQVAAEPRPGARLAVTLSISLPGMSEMSIRIDKDQASPREPFAASKVIDIPQIGGAHRINILFFDAAGAEHPVEVAFQEAEVQKTMREPMQAPSVPAPWSQSLEGGVLPSAISFHSMTSTGFRRINSDPLGIGRLTLSRELLDPLYGQVAGEFAGGGAIEVTSGSIDLGAWIVRSGDVDIAVAAGLLYSDLRVTYATFGNFDTGIGFHGGVRARVGLGGPISLEAMVDYRRVSYDYSETVVSGDRQARLQAVGLLLGVSMKF